MDSPPDCWERVVDVILENILVLQYMYKFWLIAIVENQLNWDLCQQWKYNIMPWSEAIQLIGHGGKCGRSGFKTYDCLLLQWISFENFYLLSLPSKFKFFDTSECYNRIIEVISTVHAWCVGATNNKVHASCLIKCDAKHSAKAYHGISTDYFGVGLHYEKDGIGQGIMNSGDNCNLI